MAAEGGNRDGRESAAQGRWWRIAERLGLVVLGLAFALVVLEAALQIGAAYVLRTAYDRPSEWTGKARRILCLGDSNTYGVLTGRQHTYPEVLERLWNGQAGRAEVDVINVGVPGMNSSKLRNNFRSLLASFRPATALVLVGANDLWTVRAPAEDETELTLEQRLWQRSRVFRLLHMIGRAMRGIDSEPEPEVIVKVEKDAASRARVRRGEWELDLTWTGDSAPRQGGWERALRANLNVMREAAEENGTELLLLTYAWDRDAYGLANEVIRAAQSDDLPVIDLARAFAAVCRSASCGELFRPDGHPTKLGYQIVAVTVWREIARHHGRPARPRHEASWNAVLDPEVRSRLAALPDNAS